MGKTTYFAIGAGGVLKIEVSECMCLTRSRPYAERFEQLFTDKMRRLVQALPQTDVDIGFPKVDRQQLGMTIGDVQQGNIAEGGQIVEAACAVCSQCSAAAQRKARGGSHCQHLHKFATVHGHEVLLDGIPGETNRYARINRTGSPC